MNFFVCCKDPSINPYPPKTFSSPGCQFTNQNCGASPNAPNTECYSMDTSNICCSIWPVYNEGTKAWPWDYKCG